MFVDSSVKVPQVEEGNIVLDIQGDVNDRPILFKVTNDAPFPFDSGKKGGDDTNCAICEIRFPANNNRGPS